ncbi:DDE-type integrase/transposase/recombinase [Rhodococcus sp. IEGM 1351]|uniref:DDE-type integrase/transposase/recombinase n=1 Tax=Rhodococcus sp. IEGM 1351 TaxID=3047089 RepID=UPI0024B7929C|nr:DDE-type integrase/transposase/recombinase [Rhodococcus sp. IEGM 1351]MDI9941575.1 DDE-type integrase/transposase/recombinase [Rhodococcus sp. IEGM 1351]
MPTDDEKRRERSHAVGLFRYQLICPALDTGLSTKAQGRLVREIASREHTDPFGAKVRYSRDTLDRWIRRYRAGGFEELIPSPRARSPRTDTATLELAAALKRENPARTAAQVGRIMRASSGWAPSESTLLRHFHRLELIGPAAGDSPTVFGRFEAENPNDRWTGDALHGPRIGGRKTYLFAFLDDHSRLITGYRFGFSEDTVRLGVALEPALAARGVPASVYVDNGSAFVDAWLLRACAKLGIRLVHSTPHRPQGRGKIERFFRTVREQFLVEVADTTAEDLTAAGINHRTALLELNRLLTGWIETEYHRRTHSETGQSPLVRWEAGWSRLGRTPAMPTAADLTEAFLWSEYRTVTKTATVSLHGNTYQVDHALAGRKVELVFSPFDMETVEVRYRDASHGRAVPHTITRHVHPKARPETPEPPAPVVTGIDYLALTAHLHHEQVRSDRRIGYHALYGPTDNDNDNDNDDGGGGQIPGQLSIDDLTDSLADGSTDHHGRPA